MAKTTYIYHCSENASEVFLLNLEDHLRSRIEYIDETQEPEKVLGNGSTVIILTDQFLKNKKCLEPILNQARFINASNSFSIIYYHQGLNRTDKHFDVKSHGKIDVYYYRNFWERRYTHEKQWIVESLITAENDKLAYLEELKNLKDNFEFLCKVLDTQTREVLDELKKHKYKALSSWSKGKAKKLEQDDLLSRKNLLSRVPGLNIPDIEESELLNDPYILENKIDSTNIENKLLKKLIAFKKEQLGDSEIEEAYIKEQLSKSREELNFELNDYNNNEDTEDVDSSDYINQIEKNLKEKLEAYRATAEIEELEEYDDEGDLESVFVDDDEEDEIKNENSLDFLEDEVNLTNEDELELQMLLEKQLELFDLELNKELTEKEEPTKDVLIESEGQGSAKSFYELALYKYNQGKYSQARKYYNLAKNIDSGLEIKQNERAFTKGGPLSYEDIQSLKSKHKKKSKNKKALTVFITGASSGIGKATAIKFASKGHNLIITGRRLNRLKKLQKTLSSKYGVSIVPLKFDIRNYKETKATIKALVKTGVNIDILINNAGLASGLSTVQDGNVRDWEKMIDTNIKGLLYVTRCIAPLMIKANSGHIINLGSTAGKEVYAKGNVYNATKFAVEALTKAMRIDLNGYNIRVSQVSPGHVEDTEFAKVRFHGNSKKAKIYNDFNPLKSKNIANIIYFIVTRPSHVNIQDILVMGTQQASSTVIDKTGRWFDKKSKK